MNYTLVVHAGSGNDTKACYTSGNNIVYNPRDMVGGCVDRTYPQPSPGHADKTSRIRQFPSQPRGADGADASGKGTTPAPGAGGRLTVQIDSHQATSEMITLRQGVAMPAVHDPATNLTVILDPATYLPHTIRSQTCDLRVYNYTQVSGVQLPQRFLVLQDSHVLEDFLVEGISANPEFPGEYFSASAPTGLNSGLSYSPSELASYSANMLPATPYTGTLPNLLVTLPLPGLSTLHHLYFNDAPGYRQLVLEFPDAVIVADAPPKQSLLVLQWVKEKLGREVTHVWVSHHHGDHALGAPDYVAAGAKLIVPEIARQYWADTIPDAELLTISFVPPP